jgi:hypothetical protein
MRRTKVSGARNVAVDLVAPPKTAADPLNLNRDEQGTANARRAHSHLPGLTAMFDGRHPRRTYDIA